MQFAKKYFFRFMENGEIEKMEKMYIHKRNFMVYFCQEIEESHFAEILTQ